jgi:hypothetical protein
MKPNEITGQIVQYEEPSWDPLLELAADQVDDFMWMFEAKLDDGAALHAYKHRWTRRYIHLTDCGRAFAYIRDDLYREVCPECQLVLVICGRGLYQGGIPRYTDENGEGDGLDAG